VTFTSGTTGVSKGVLVYWAQAYLTTTEETLAAFGPDEVSYSPLPLFHISGMGGVYKMAMCGGRVVMRDQFSIQAYFDDIRTFGVTTSVMLESMIATLMVEADKGFEKPPTLQRLIVVPVPPNIDAFKARFGVKVATMYNMTETSGPLSSQGFEVDDSLEGSCGYLRPQFEAMIADENDEPVPDGEIGELLVRGKQPWTITTEYLGAPEATAAAWRNGWFHTGDSFRRDAEGRYYFVDRLKDAIRRRGENISSIEVENELRAHPDVAEAAAVPALSDEGQEEVKVFLVLRAGAVFDPVGIIQFLIPRMPHFMVPRYLQAIDQFPKTPSQKTQKHLLRAMGASAATFDREAHGIKVTSRSAQAPAAT
jgi:crotonobetaine/carnitine-CoA ligase